MYSVMVSFIERLDSGEFDGTSVLKWGCPVPFFGDLARSRIATVGINPSNREFADSCGEELTGPHQRLPTLNSLGVNRWGEIDALQVREIVGSCHNYFTRNPYDRWFGVLEQVLTMTLASFYPSAPHKACHIDLVPYPTAVKWGELPADERRTLLAATGKGLGVLLRDTKIAVLVLNGRSVVRHFEDLIETSLEATHMANWDLPRSRGAPVRGFAYAGDVEIVAGVTLHRTVKVLGYNHNLQSSFGVTGEVISEIADWVGWMSEIDYL